MVNRTMTQNIKNGIILHSIEWLAAVHSTDDICLGTLDISCRPGITEHHADMISEWVRDCSQQHIINTYRVTTNPNSSKYRELKEYFINWMTFF